MTLRARTLFALLLAIPATAAAGCGAASIQNAVDPVAQAAQNAGGAGGAQMVLHLQVSAAGQTVPVDGTALIDQRRMTGSFSMTTVAPGVGAMRIDAILDGHDMYMHFPGALGNRIPKPWVKLDLAKAAKQAGVDLGALQQGGSTDPGQYLSMLRGAGGARAVGSETIRGVRTTHYEAYIDFNKAAAQVGGTAKKALQQLESVIGVESMPVDVWIDRDKLVRRVTMQLNAQSPVPFSMSMTMDVLRYHVPVHVTPPPADQVYDVTGSLGKLGG
jgi:hypothetical protein